MITHDAVGLGRHLALARAGDGAALGHLLELYRDYLRLKSRSLIGPSLRARIDPSDVVQETFLKAHRDFGQFLGEGEPELTAWLRRILVYTLIDQARYHRSQARNHCRQESLELILEHSPRDMPEVLTDASPSPSAVVMHRERAVMIAEALRQLSSEYREVFVLRNVEHVPIEQIATRMGRTTNAVRKLWTRVMLALRQELERTQ